jgi:hypothetical protein
MKPWPADFSACAVEEIITLRTTNRAWYNELERNMRDLMNRKLAKQIDSEEYSAQRALSNKEFSECKRRATVLSTELINRYNASAAHADAG